MRSFGLTPDQVLLREPALDARRFPSLAFSILYGALGFGAVSVVAYCIWAFRLIGNPAGLYSSTAVVYIVLTGLVLSRLVIGAGVAGRFAMLFAVAFLAYALAWCAFWFGLRGKFQADFWGSVAGLAAFTFLLCRAFEKRDGFLTLFLGLLAFHSAGYYLGEYLYGSVRGPTGRLLFGAGHGLGFGAGLGFVLFHAQSPLKARLRTASSIPVSTSARN